MYEDYYGLREKPFSIIPNPDLIYWGRMHRMAFAMLEFGLLNQAGFTVITGEIGSGKTTLTRHLLRRSGDDMIIGVITNTPHGRDELLRWIMLSFDQPIDGEYLLVFQRFRSFLLEQARYDRRAILIIDEAQNLGLGALEELRMLSNFNTDNKQLLQLILIGQPQLRDQLRAPELEQFAQRVSVDFHLKPLGFEEVGDYIRFRLAAVSAQKDIFTDEACSLVGKASGGIPRVINILCDTAMVYGFSMRAETITGEIVGEVIGDRQKYGVLPISMSSDT